MCSSEWSIDVGDEVAVRLWVREDDEPEECIDPAAADLFQDVFGTRPEITEDDALFEIVAVPDDVATADPAPDGVVLVVGELRVTEAKDVFGDLIATVESNKGRSLPDVRR